MGAKAVFTCAPYLLDDAPQFGEVIGWSESNAVIYANSVLGARTLKHADYLDLFIAMTGRAPATGVYHDEGRRPQVILSITPPTTKIDDSFWPLLGWLAGTHAPHQIPLITRLKTSQRAKMISKAYALALAQLQPRLCSILRATQLKQIYRLMMGPL